MPNKTETTKLYLHCFFNRGASQILFVSSPHMKLYEQKKYKKLEWIGTSHGDTVRIDVGVSPAINFE